MIRKVLCAFSLLAVASAVNPARAEVDQVEQDAQVGEDAEFEQDTPVDYARMGCYLGLSGTVALDIELEDRIEEVGLNGDVDQSPGLHTRLGCRFMERLSGELHFEYLDGFDVSVDGVDGHLDMWSLTADFKVYLLTGRTQPFVTLGFGYLDFDGSYAGMKTEGWDFVVRYGGGLDFYLTENIVLDIDATVAHLTDEENDGLGYVAIGWGFQYRF
jgi:opacity protein-like surface antigen